MTNTIKELAVDRRGALIITGKGLLGMGLACALPATAYAHRERTTLTDIYWDSVDQMLYVTHSFHIHEAEQLLHKAGILGKADLYSLRSRAEIALYAQDNFSIKSQNDERFDLSILGAENSGRNCYVYQQVKLETAPTILEISCTLLRSLDPEIINHVDTNFDGKIVSLAFSGNDKVKYARSA